MQDDSIKQTLKVALGVCLVSSLLVSTAAVTLNAIQSRNRRLDKIKNILVAGDLFEPEIDVAAVYEERVQPLMVDLSTGESVPEDRFDDVLNIEGFDIDTMANDATYGEAIPLKTDIASIKRRPKYMVVYLVMENDSLEKVILPIHGKGLWSTLYGFLALNEDLRTVSGITFYQHGETPGLGGEVDNPRWKDIWKGKQAFDAERNVSIQVVKGLVDPSSAGAENKVDGLSGATITTRGVDSLIHYWLGAEGYGPFLAQLQQDSHE